MKFSTLLVGILIIFFVVFINLIDFVCYGPTGMSSFASLFLGLVAVRLVIVLVGVAGFLWLLKELVEQILSIFKGASRNYHNMSEDEKAKTRQAARDCAAVGKHLFDLYREFKDAKK